MVPGERALSALRLANRNAVRLGKASQGIARQGVQCAASGDDEGPLRAPQRLGRGGELVICRRLRTEPDGALLEQVRRVLPGHRLHVLRHRERHRAAERRIRQHLDGAGERDHQLLGANDAVEVARHRTQAVVRGHRGIHLLQDRVRGARGEYVARQEEDGEPVDVRGGRGGHQIRRAGADRGRRSHHAPAHVGLRERDRGVRHPLLVVRAQGGQRLPMPVQGLAQARDIAVPEDREDPAE